MSATQDTNMQQSSELTSDADAAMGCNRSVVDIGIVGVGAAGMMAAIFAGREAAMLGKPVKIAALDGASKLGAKILVAGGGRCNVTHDVVTQEDYAGSSMNAIRNVLRSFSVDETIAFFADLGVQLKREDTGKLFPVTDKARTVLDALLREMKRVNVDTMTGCRVSGIQRVSGDGKSDQEGFEIQYTIGQAVHQLHARQLILATGGKALPRTGSDGLGYHFARDLGHHVTDTTPALVPLVLEKNHWLTSLSGLAFDVEIQLLQANGKRLHHQAGPMLCTHFGISGPAPMDISRHWLAARAHDPNIRLVVNFTKGFNASDTYLSSDQCHQWLQQAFEQNAKRKLIDLFTNTPLPKRFIETLIRHASTCEPHTLAGQINKQQRQKLVHALTQLPLPVIKDRGYTFAEVTAGGVPLDEVVLKTMASRKSEGLYLCGEILNVDGRIGGYNFQWAWCTGRLAGLAATRALNDHGD